MAGRPQEDSRMKMTAHEKAKIATRRRRPYGEIKRVAEEEGVSYDRLRDLCARFPGRDTRELARLQPEDAAESGRRGGLRSAESRRNS